MQLMCTILRMMDKLWNFALKYLNYNRLNEPAWANEHFFNRVEYEKKYILLVNKRSLVTFFSYICLGDSILSHSLYHHNLRDVKANLRHGKGRAVNLMLTFPFKGPWVNGTTRKY